MKSILFLRKGDAVGGIEEIILLLAQRFKEEGLLNPLLAVIDKRGPFAQRFSDYFPNAVFSLPFEKGLFSVQAISNLDTIVKQNQVAILQSEMFRESILARRYRRKNPAVKHIFHAHTYIQRAMIPAWKKVAYHALDYWTSSRVDAFASISEANIHEMVSRSRIPLQKIHLIRNGITTLGPPDPVPTTPLLNPSVAIIATLLSTKQQHLAIQTIGEILSEGLKITLHLIGSPRDLDYLHYLQSLTHECKVTPQVIFHGYQPREAIGSIVQNIPVILLPSLSEGIPTCIIEGMSMRKLVIATNVGGTSELVHHKHNGLLLDEWTPKALKDTLRTVFTTPASHWEPMREAGYKTWAENYTVEKMVNNFVHLYQQLGVLQ